VHWLRGLHGVPGWDSGALVDPFMRAGTYPARHLATSLPEDLCPLAMLLFYVI